MPPEWFSGLVAAYVAAENFVLAAIISSIYGRILSCGHKYRH
jgi:hypothetical protein